MKKYRKFFYPVAFFAIVLFFSHLQTFAETCDYLIIVSRNTKEIPEWNAVCEILLKKHKDLNPEISVYEKDVFGSLDSLKEKRPKFACFLAKPEEANGNFVRSVHRLVRSLDDDPYPDVFWGILSGYDAENARKIAEHSEPLVIRKGAASMPFDIDKFEEGVRWNDQVQNEFVRKTKDGKTVTEKGPDDPIEDIARMLNEYDPDLWATSAHATERDWVMGYSFKTGKFVHKDGRLYGVSLKGERFEIDSQNPKVYLPVGNCLIGHIDKTDCMATAYLKSAGCMQMIGYIVPTWFGFAGWGVLDYFIDQPGRYTLNEAFFANQIALDWNIREYIKANPDFDPAKPTRMTRENQGISGLIFDRDVVAFYGDPAWKASLPDGQKAWKQTLVIEDSKGETGKKWITFTVTPNDVPDPWKPARKTPASTAEGRFSRPIIEFLPKKFGDIELIEGKEFEPVITENFILIPKPNNLEENSKTVMKTVFEARER